MAIDPATGNSVPAPSNVMETGVVEAVLVDKASAQH
jgi:hypothetical protein